MELIEAGKPLFHRNESDAGPRLQHMMMRILLPGDFCEPPAGFETIVASGSLIEKSEAASQKDPSFIKGFLQLQGMTTDARLREVLVSCFLSQGRFIDTLVAPPSAQDQL